MSENMRYLRFDVARRIEHLVLILSFTTLGVTGLVQKYAEAGVSDSIIRFFGGIETTRIIHHTAAVIFLLEAVYHLVVLGYKLYIQRVQASMLPGLKDIRDVIQFMGYNLGLTKDHPRMGRFNFAEKAEYWAMLWGLVIMGLTGIMLWNPIATAKLLPGQFLPAAKSAHGMEAVLAVLAIILWHFYNVHLKKWNWSMIKGTLSKEEMAEEHALELEEIEAGKKPAPLSAQERSKRMKSFVPVSTVVSLVLIVGTYQILNSEKTAITTVPPALGTVVVYERQTATPLPTAAPTSTTTPTAQAATSVPGVRRKTAVPTAGPAGGGATTWNGGVDKIFQNTCGSCHGSGAAAGLNVTSYANLMKGGTSGAAILPGNPDNSLVIQKMKAGHPQTFNDADLATVIAWIKAGALEK